MLTFGVICALVATASAGYASSSSGAGSGGLYNTNSYGQTYGSSYPYAGYSNFPAAPFASPYDFQNAYNQYYNSISSNYAKQLTTSYAGDGASVSAYASLSPSKKRHQSKKDKNLFAQQFAYQAALQNSINANINAIRNQAYGGAYGYPAYSGTSAGTGAYAGGSSYAGGSGGGSVGSYGGVGTGGTYGGTQGGRPAYSNGGARPAYSNGGSNYASAGGSVGNGYQHQYSNVYPANPARPNLDSRFGGNDAPVGVSYSSGQPGVVGVSSFSSSSDINGHKQRESASSVNNNGKVTTYYTRS